MKREGGPHRCAHCGDICLPDSPQEEFDKIAPDLIIGTIDGIHDKLWAILHRETEQWLERFERYLAPESASAKEKLEQEIWPLCIGCGCYIQDERKALQERFKANPDPNQLIERPNGSCFPILNQACRCPWGQEDFIRELLAAGAEIHNDTRTSPVFDTVWANSSSALDLLYERGADLEARDYDGLTPLHLAAGGRSRYHYSVRYSVIELTVGLLKALEWLIKHGADLEIRDQNDRTPLHLAAIGQVPGAIEMLLDHGANIDALDRNSRSPLRGAAKTPRPDNLAVLLKRGAGDGLDQGQWDNLLGMAETMLRRACRDLETIRSNWPERPEEHDGAARKMVQDRQAVYDLLRQYRPGN